MGEVAEYYRDRRRENQSKKNERCMISAQQFGQAEEMAKNSGLTLEQHSERHYTLRKDSVIIFHIWPGAHHIKGTEHAFYLPIWSDWSLLDVVRTVCRELNKGFE